MKSIKHFLCAFVFGDKATEETRKNNLSDDVLASFNEATIYEEGRGFRLEVRKKHVGTMKKLAEIKMSN